MADYICKCKKPEYSHDPNVYYFQMCLSCGKAIASDVIMKIEKPELLFVDDRTKRIHHALKNFPEYDVTIATCVPEALRAMSREDWDLISLDHDLNGHDFQDPDTQTCGMEIVRYIGKTGWPQQRKKPIFYIHSSNLFAAHLMIVELKKQGFEAYYKPIVYVTENMKYDKEGLPIK